MQPLLDTNVIRRFRQTRNSRDHLVKARLKQTVLILPPQYTVLVPLGIACTVGPWILQDRLH